MLKVNDEILFKEEWYVSPENRNGSEETYFVTVFSVDLEEDYIIVQNLDKSKSIGMRYSVLTSLLDTGSV